MRLDDQVLGGVCALMHEGRAARLHGMAGEQTSLQFREADARRRNSQFYSPALSTAH